MSSCPSVHQEGELVAEDDLRQLAIGKASLGVCNRKAGAVAFSRTGAPDDYGDAIILARFGETPHDIEPPG